MLLLNMGGDNQTACFVRGDSVVKRDMIDERRWPYLLSWNGFNLD